MAEWVQRWWDNQDLELRFKPSDSLNCALVLSGFLPHVRQIRHEYRKLPNDRLGKIGQDHAKTPANHQG